MSQVKGPLEAYTTLLRVGETQQRWADDVAVLLLDVNPPPDPAWHGVETIQWWDTDPSREFMTFIPGQGKWVLMNSTVFSSGTPFSKSGLTNLANYEATLAVSWQGKLMSGIRIEVRGADLPNLYPTVTEIARPPKRELHRLNRQRMGRPRHHTFRHPIRGERVDASTTHQLVLHMITDPQPPTPATPIDPHELVSVDLDAEEGIRWILAGSGTEEPVSDEGADALYGEEDEPTDTGVWASPRIVEALV